MLSVEHTKTQSQAQQINKDDRSPGYADATAGVGLFMRAVSVQITCFAVAVGMRLLVHRCGRCCHSDYDYKRGIVFIYIYIRTYTIYKNDWKAHSNECQCVHENRISPSLMYPSFMMTTGVYAALSFGTGCVIYLVSSARSTVTVAAAAVCS